MINDKHFNEISAVWHIRQSPSKFPLTPSDTGIAEIVVTRDEAGVVFLKDNIQILYIPEAQWLQLKRIL